MKRSLHALIKKEIALFLSTEQMEAFGAICINQEQKTLNIALLNNLPSHQSALQKLFCNYQIHFQSISQDDFAKALSWLKTEEEIQALLQKIPHELQTQSQNNSSIARLFEILCQEAIKKQASDIHIEHNQTHCKIKMRIDGILIPVFLFELALFNPLSICIKLLSHLNIAENKMAQDGRFSMHLQKDSQTRTFDFRVSILPLIEGESIVIRILDKQQTILPLHKLGFEKEDFYQLKELINLPYGLVFITGPTGSGKSTTLYALLEMIKNKNLKIITLEDPVEYKIDNICQVQISKKVSFGEVLRNVLRQDPDVILVGEVRDKETLSLSIQAAFTGHLVLATLHTNDSVSTIARLLDMGMKDYYIAQSLSAIISQRLLRKICPYCQEQPGQSQGCELCNFTGYCGREAIAEILLKDQYLEDFIFGKINKQTLLNHLMQKNPHFLLHHKAQQKIKQNKTDLKEVYRVLHHAF